MKKVVFTLGRAISAIIFGCFWIFSGLSIAQNNLIEEITQRLEKGERVMVYVIDMFKRSKDPLYWQSAENVYRMLWEFRDNRAVYFVAFNYQKDDYPQQALWDEIQDKQTLQLYDQIINKSILTYLYKDEYLEEWVSIRDRMELAELLSKQKNLWIGHETTTAVFAGDLSSENTKSFMDEVLQSNVKILIDPNVNFYAGDDKAAIDGAKQKEMEYLHEAKARLAERGASKADLLTVLPPKDDFLVLDTCTSN